MSDEATGGAAPAAAPTETNPTNPEGDAGVQNPNSPEAGANDAAETPEGAEGGDEGTEGAEEAFEDDGEEPEVKKRMTPKDFIIQRQKAKIEKMKAQKGEEGDGDGDDDDPEGDAAPVKPDGDDPKDGGNDTDAQLEAMRPIVEQHLADQDAQEVTAFLEENPDFAPYAGKVERLMKHPSRRAIPVDELFYAAAGKHLMKIGADRARKADAEAKGTRAGGDSNREGMAPIDWSKATPEQVAAEQQRVREKARY